MNKQTTGREIKQPADFERFQMQALKLGLLIDEARHYLMGVDPKETSVQEVVENTLEKLGFGKNGLQSNFLTP